MPLDKATVLHIARLARIALRDDEVEPLAKELSGILAWVDQLAELDTEKVEPMTSVVEARLVLREDVVSEGNPPEAIIKNAPQRSEGFFVVPKVIE